MSSRAALFLGIVLQSLAAVAQIPYLVKDLDTTQSGSYSYASSPDELLPAFGKIFFQASTPEFGAELWVTDGTEAGTRLVKDIWPGANGSEPQEFVVVNDYLLFSAEDGVHGSELWRTDGTAEGTRLVKDIDPAQSGLPRYFESHFRACVLNGVAYFRAYDPARGDELWRTDGTEAGTWLLKDIRSGSSAGYPDGFTVVGSTFFFAATDSRGTELWKSDGTVAGTGLVRDLNPATSSYPSMLRALGGYVVFSANDGAGEALWRSDGTSAGTQLLSRIDARGDYYSYYPHLGIVMNDVVYFGANDGVTGIELWRTDGTAVGTTLVKDINPGAGSSSPAVSSNPYAGLSVAILNGSIFFSANDGTHGSELWKSDGTPAGTVLVKDAVAGASSSTPSWMTRAGSRLVFAVEASSDSLWSTDGTPAGTTQIRSLSPSSEWTPREFCELNGIAYYAAGWGGGIFFGTPPPRNRELWRSDGTAIGTYRLKDIAPSVNGNGSPWNAVQLGNRLLFRSARSYAWATDGTAAGTVQLGPQALGPWAVLNGAAYFVSGDSKLWKTDGTPAGTALVKDVLTPNEGSLDDLVASGNSLFFIARYRDSSNLDYYALWKSDGTPGGTVKVFDIQSGVSNSFLTEMVAVGGKVAFTADSQPGVDALWISDGTAGGTKVLAAVSPRELVAVGYTLYFVVGYELWKSDGTPAGTVRVLTLDDWPLELTAMNGVLYFGTGSNFDFDRLWRSNGTAAGTVLLKWFPSECGHSLTWSGSTLFFAGCDSAHGGELWRTNGTAQGTMMVREIFPGTSSSTADEIIAVDASLDRMLAAYGQIYFQANDGAAGEELWRSDGTASGTGLLGDLVAGTGSSSPEPLGAAANHVYFSAWQPGIGEELWAVDFVAAPLRPCGDSNGDGIVNVADVFYLVNHVFAGGPPPVGRVDLNIDGAIGPPDVFQLVAYLFARGGLNC